jgi:hypothetical protein
MRYEIGEYGLTRGKDVCWASPDKPIHYLWYVEESVEGDFDTYEEAVERIKEKMRSDKETGRQDENLKLGDLIIYFTAGLEEQSIYLKMHIAGTYDEETLKIVHEYDDRIIVEEL